MHGLVIASVAVGQSLRMKITNNPTSLSPDEKVMRVYVFHLRKLIDVAIDIKGFIFVQKETLKAYD